MDFQISEEQQLLINAVQKMIEEQFDDAAVAKFDKEERFPFEFLNACAQLDLLGMSVPEEYGGTEADNLTQALVLEEIASASGAMAFVFLLSVMFAGSILSKYGSNQQKEEILPDILNGDCLFALGLTEPGAGSDASAVRTTAVLEGDKFIINGVKTFCTIAEQARYIIGVCITDPDKPAYQGMSIILIPTKANGVRMSKIEKVGMRSIPSYEVYLNNVEVPAVNLLGQLNQGWKQLMGILDMERLLASAVAVGMAEAAFKEAADYANQRVQFGQPIGKFQAIQHKIADMRILIDTSRLVIHKTCWMLDNKESIRYQSAMAKTLATEAAFTVADDAMQIMGGMGYSMASKVQRIWRDVRLLRIAAGTNEIQRNIIGQQVLAEYR